MLSLANSHLLEGKYLEKLLAILDDPKSLRVLEYYRDHPKLDLAANLVPTVQLILDSSLTADAKFTYLVSALTLRFPLGESELSPVFEARPNPLDEWEAAGVALPHYAMERKIVEGALMANFKGPANSRTHTHSSELYRALNRSLAFAFGGSSVTYGESLSKQGDNFFTPSLTPASYMADESIYSAVPRDLLEDLTSVEFIRFMRYFARGTPNILLPWMKERLRAGIVTFTEMRDSGRLLKAPLEPLDSRWASVINNLAEDEIPEFQALLREHNGVSSLVSGTLPDMGEFLAYVFVAGGKPRFRELVRHIVENSGVDETRFGLPRLRMRWKNPYSNNAGNKPSLKPYVRAIENDKDPSIPFEMLLMIQ